MPYDYLIGAGKGDKGKAEKQFETVKAENFLELKRPETQIKSIP